MTFKEFVAGVIKEADIKKINRREKEAFLRQYYIGQTYDFMTHDEVMAALKMDGIVQE